MLILSWLLLVRARRLLLIGELLLGRLLGGHRRRSLMLILVLRWSELDLNLGSFMLGRLDRHWSRKTRSLLEDDLGVWVVVACLSWCRWIHRLGHEWIWCRHKVLLWRLEVVLKLLRLRSIVELRVGFHWRTGRCLSLELWRLHLLLF